MEENELSSIKKEFLTLEQIDEIRADFHNLAANGDEITIIDKLERFVKDNGTMNDDVAMIFDFIRLSRNISQGHIVKQTPLFVTCGFSYGVALVGALVHLGVYSESEIKTEVESRVGGFPMGGSIPTA